MKKQPADDPWTIAAIGAVIPCLAAIAHEAIGHGVTCRLVGGTVALLSATHFGCRNGSALVDAMGPAGNLLCAAIATPLLFRSRLSRSPAAYLFLFLTAAINLCWFAGEMAHSAMLTIEDEANFARQLGWPAWWRPLAITLALILYFAIARFSAAVVRRWIADGQPAAAVRRRLVLAHGAGILTFAVAGLFWTKAPLAAAHEAILTVGFAAIPMWLGILPALRSVPPTGSRGRPIARSIPWILTSSAIVLAFLLSQARGIDR